MKATDFLTFEQRLGYQFQQKELIDLALTHSSFGENNNERLEFLGDGLLNALVAHLLFQHHPNADEGLLSRARAVLVCEDSLANIAKSIGIAPLLRLSTGEHQLKGREKPSILADALEAVIAAVFLEAGFETLKTVVAHHFDTLTRHIELGEPAKDAKSVLQEYLQKHGLNPPLYKVEQKIGQDHAGQFLVSCSVPELKQKTQAWGTNKRTAEQAAATQMLENNHIKQTSKTQKKVQPAQSMRSMQAIQSKRPARPTKLIDKTKPLVRKTLKLKTDSAPISAPDKPIKDTKKMTKGTL